MDLSGGTPAWAVLLSACASVAHSAPLATTPGATALFGTLVATYDGDTPQAERAALRRDARILLTNPDMLHQAVMPNHAQWAHVLGALRYVAVDEANPDPNHPESQP